LFTTSQAFFQALALYLFIGLMAWKIYPKTQGLMREMLFFSLLALTVTSSVGLAGVLVVFVLLIAPILVASMQKKFRVYPFAIVFGWSFSIAALFFAFYADLPTGYTICALGAFLALVSVLFLSDRKRSMEY
jgi:zinc/manganese transport system permease protein